MSALIPSEQQVRGLSEGLSKRQLMKLEKAIKMFQSQENQQIKHPKRRGHSNINANEPTHRKQIKIDPHASRTQHDQIISSPLNSSQQVSNTTPKQQEIVRQLPNHLNPRYNLPEGEGGIFNYLLYYTYSEGEKKLQKESQDWSQIDNLSNQSLNVVQNKASALICQKLNLKLKEVKDKLREPLGKAHREFNQKFLKKEFLMQ